MSKVQFLEFFQDYSAPLAKTAFLRAYVDHEDYDAINHAPVDFNVSTLHKLLNNPIYMQEISVIIVDYAMPTINGIELCQQLNNLPIKKILVTGEADHRSAVTAFNDNIIDRFIRKDSPTLLADIRAYVSTLINQYFRDSTQSLLSHLEAGLQLPLSDPIFSDFFQHWCQAHNIKSYSIIDKQGSFMAINQKNQVFYYIIHTDNSLNNFVKLHDDVQGAKDLITAVMRREKIPFFGIGKEAWQFEPVDWPKHFYQPKILEGRETYYWTICTDNL